MSTFNYYWRLLATGLCFATFSIGGLLMSLLIFPLILLAVRDEETRKLRTRRIISRGFRAFIGLMEFLGVLEVEFENAEHSLEACRGKVIIANHPSLIDVVVLISRVPNADCIIKEGLWQNPFFKGVLNAADYIRNGGNAGALLESCDTSLSQGSSLVIFPEGTRTEPEQTVSFKKGASSIAIRCNADIVPVYISVTPTTLTKNERWYNIPDSKVKLRLRVGKLIPISEFRNDNQSLFIQTRQLASYLQENYTKNLEQYERA